MQGRQEPARGAKEGNHAAEGVKQQSESMLDTAKGFASSVVGKVRACACCIHAHMHGTNKPAQVMCCSVWSDALQSGQDVRPHMIHLPLFPHAVVTAD